MILNHFKKKTKRFPNPSCKSSLSSSFYFPLICYKDCGNNLGFEDFGLEFWNLRAVIGILIVIIVGSWDLKIWN
jgi:hypothetical protein